MCGGADTGYGDRLDYPVDEDEFEECECVMPGCKNTVRHHKKIFVEFRLGYVEGAGQLCPACWEKTYREK